MTNETNHADPNRPLAGQGAILTGASRGLGRALALALAAEGVELVLVARELAPLEEVVGAIEAAGGVAHAVAEDVGARDAAARVAGIAGRLLGSVDLLIHNASTLGPVPLRALTEIRREAFEEVLAVNLLGPFALTNAVVGAMDNRGRGTVISISSDAAVEGYPTWGPYGASKAALDHLSRVYAAEHPELRFAAIDPGEMDTTTHADAIPDADPATLAQPRDVAARIVSWLRDPTEVPSGARRAASELGADAVRRAS
jgi:NAD(P)-dependent dehydrogenase (short-subunit alcohol dehydrogenase family)